MRRHFYGLTAALIAAVATLTGQTITSRLTIIDTKEPVPVSVFSNDALQQLGTTNPNGVLLFDTSALGGKPSINVRVEQCPTQTDVALFPATSTAGSDEYQRCQPGCRCRRRAGAFLWGDDYRMSLGGKPFFETPRGYWSLVAVGGTAGLLVAKGAGGGDSTPAASTTPTTPATPTTPTTPAPDFNTILGAYNLSGTVQSRGGCSFNNFISTFTLGGTQPATTGQLVEQITRNMTGTSTLQGTTWMFALNGSGTVPGLGNYTEVFAGQVNGSSLTGTETITFPCGVVAIAQTGTHR